MPSKIRGLAGAFIALALLCAPAIASSSIDLSNPAFAPVNGPTSIPVGAAEFCKAHRDECGPMVRVVETETLTEAAWNQLIGINDQVNGSVTPGHDADLYNVNEYWTYPNGRATARITRSKSAAS